ncbi:GNAT family N-acetyltransferase [Lewinellaceae bacterium SD302]|nr:GNAT family N-acetyltransferase [Lewinellaceae bacterium SD302]
MTIRFARPDDLPAVVELCQMHAEYERAEYDPTGKVEALQQQFFSARPSAYCLLVEQDDQILGYATYALQFSTWDADHYVYMDCLFVREGARSNGIGEQLMNRIKMEARAMGCNLIQWQTPDFNVRAIKFYERIGAMGKSKERFFLDV